MSVDPYHFVYTSEVFQKTNCIWHENTCVDFLRSLLISLGFKSKNNSNKIWAKGEKQVIICLVDDFATCAESLEPNTPYLFDKQTLVITDNHINCPAQYNVLNLPTSFFGIYYYCPEPLIYNPTRRFNISVNRLDIKRLLVLLETIRHSLLYYPEPDTLDWIKYNFLLWNNENLLETDRVQNLVNTYNSLETDLQSRYANSLVFVQEHFEICSHDMTLEQAAMCANVNLVLETYSGENTVALSEKTFRALVTPAPCMLFSGRYSVAYLASLGFDVLADIVPHKYDRLSEKDKIIEFVAEAANTAHDLASMDSSKLEKRLQQAAVHNQNLLHSFQTQWPADFAQWLPKLIQMIS